MLQPGITIYDVVYILILIMMLLIGICSYVTGYIKGRIDEAEARQSRRLPKRRIKVTRL